MCTLNKKYACSERKRVVKFVILISILVCPFCALYLRLKKHFVSVKLYLSTGRFDLSLVLLQPGPKHLLNKHYLTPKRFF